MPIGIADFRDRFFSGYYSFMEDALGAILAKRNAITQNIANINNPNYHPVHVEYENQFEQYYNEFWKKYGPDEAATLDIPPMKLNFDPSFHEPGSTGATHLKPTIVRDPVGKVDLNH